VSRRDLIAGLAAGGLLALTSGTSATTASARSLPTVTSGQRPGPDVLYAPAPRAPQLENVAPFSAAPLLVSGASAYRDGEFLYQDFLHDDRGAAGTSDPSDPTSGSTLSWKAKAGTLTYPTAPVFANNAADLVELRVKPLTDATALRVTLNTMLDPERVAFTVAIGASDATRTWPHGANASSPAERFLTVHGATGELLEAADGHVITPAPTVSVDRERRQVTVHVPHAAWDPGRAVVPLRAGVGLWDPAAGTYLAPQTSASESAPGGAASNGAALFNVAFRTAEPLPAGPPPGVTLIDSSIASAVDSAQWRELAQSKALAAGDLSPFTAQVDFGKLADRVEDLSTLPRTGAISRIVADADRGQGLDTTKLCGRQPLQCDGALPGQLQAYVVYVPPGKPAPAGGYGLTLLLHSLNENENQYTGSNHQRQLGDRGTGYLVVTPSSRGPDGDYTDTAEANVFATWADVARHYPLDPARTSISGWSMGGGAVFRLMARWPDLFARGASVGAASNVDQTGYVPALRNSPTLTWVADGDEGTNPAFQQQAIDNQATLGLDFVFDTFATGDHATLSLNDEFGPFAEYLGDHRAVLDPPHVTYGLVPRLQFPQAGVVADHAHWASGLVARDAKAESSIDARSEGFGLADPVPSSLLTDAGVLTGGRFGAMSYVERRVVRAPAATAPVRDRLVVRARNLATATIDARRARLSCAPELQLESDGPLDLRIACASAGPRASCGRTITLLLPRVRGRRIVSAAASRRGRVLARARGHRLSRLALRRPTAGAFTVRVRVRTSGRRPLTVTVLRRIAACAR